MRLNPERAAPFAGGLSFLNPPVWQGVMKQLVHLVQFSGGLQVVDGKFGAGKTVFAQQMAKVLTDEICAGVLALPAGLSMAQVFDCILTTLGIDVSDGQSVGQSIIALRQFDATLKRENLRRVLIIDDAHNLDDQALAAIASVFQGGRNRESGLSLVFLGEPGIAQRLDALNLVDVEVRDCQLPGFSLSETLEFLNAEFVESGVDQPFPFSDETVTKFWNESAGKPGAILKLARNALRIEDQAPMESWWSSVPKLHLWALVVLLVILGWYLGSQYFRWDEFKEAITNAKALSIPPGSVQKPIVVASVSDPSVVDSDAIMSTNQAVKSPIDRPSLAELNDEEMQAFGQQSATESMISATAASEGSIKSDASSLVVETQPTSLGEPPSPASTSANISIPKQASEPKVARQAEQSLIAPYPKALPSSPAELDRLSRDEKILMTLSDNGYVLQIMASTLLPALEEFVADQPNQSSLHIYRSLKSGKSWFIVVEGFYADRDSALAAMSNLPSNQLKVGPWPKSVATVKLEIAARNQQSH
jgi:DamX protein